jgi:hypothetical protein
MANFLLFSAKGKRQTEVCFLGRQTINGNRRLLFLQTCPSMQKSVTGTNLKNYGTSGLPEYCTVYSRMRRKLRIWLYLGERMRLCPKGMKYIQKVRSERTDGEK